VCRRPLGSGSECPLAISRHPLPRKPAITLIKALSGTKTFRCLYDFGDGWDPRIKVEKKLPAGACPQVPYCIDGANACTPEDMGGGLGCAEFLKAMADPGHPEHEAMMGWYGVTFAPTVFDRESANE